MQRDLPLQLHFKDEAEGEFQLSKQAFPNREKELHLQEVLSEDGE